MAKLTIANASTTKSYEYPVCGKYAKNVLNPSSSVEIPVAPIPWYSAAEMKAFYENLDGANGGEITVTYDAETNDNGISFKVVAAVGGANIQGAVITYGEGLTVTTNASGVASLATIEPGTYNLSVAKTGYQTYTTSVVVPADGTVNVVCHFALLTAAQTNNMHFLVTAAATGLAIEGATITYGEGLTLTTAADGTASVASLVAGTYNITVEKATYTSYTTSVTFAAGILGSLVANVALVLA